MPSKGACFMLLEQSLAVLMCVAQRIPSACAQDWEKTNSSHTSIPFSREYALSDEPNTYVFKQNIGNFSLTNGASVHIR